jgi:non-heme chloroperoxidase
MQDPDDIAPIDPRRRQLMVAGLLAAAATTLPLPMSMARAVARDHRPI